MYVGIYFESVCKVFTLRVYVGYLLEGVLIDAFSRIVVQKKVSFN